MMSIELSINKLLEQQLAKRRAANYVVLSSVTHSALRREIHGADAILDNPKLLKQTITEYMGMKVIVLDNDYFLVEVG